MTTRRQALLGAAGILTLARGAGASERPIVVNAHHTS